MGGGSKCLITWRAVILLRVTSSLVFFSLEGLENARLVQLVHNEERGDEIVIVFRECSYLWLDSISICPKVHHNLKDNLLTIFIIR